ncbi:MAG: magnesium transporter [Methanomassiliicoccales archaeon]|jgi:mgtE-like transporter|nr:magnesium transporter [Methanomassiliicoccales archaeon]
MGASVIIKMFITRNREVFAHGLVANMISSMGDLLAGATLGFMTNTLALLPGLMVLIPPAIGMRGNIFGALGSRLGTAMHIGTFEMTIKKGSVLRQNIEASIFLTMIISLLMGLFAKLITDLMGFPSISVWDFIFISVLGGMLAGFVLIFINILVAYIGFKKGWDIDNFSAPIITAAGDIVTLPMLFLSAIIVLNFPEVIITLFSILFIILTLVVSFFAAKSKEELMRRILIECIPVLILCILLDIGAGMTIEHKLEELVAFPAILVMIPPFLEDANALGGILTARLASMLHMGLIKPRRIPGRIEIENFAIILILSLWVFTLVGISSHFVAELLGLSSPGLWAMLLISLLAGLLTILVLVIISYYIATLTFRFSLDPDNHSIPLTSSAIDFVGAFFLMETLLLIGIA